MAQTTAGHPARRKTSGLAIAAFVLSLVACLPPLAIAGGVLGMVALVRMRGRPEVGGKALAVASLPFAAFSVLVATIAINNFINFNARSMMSEAKSNLKALYTGEQSYAAAHDGDLAADMRAIGFQPQRANRYAYFLAPSGPTEARDAAQLDAPAAPVIIGVDTWKRPQARPLPTLADTGCPVTLKRADPGPDLQVGIGGSSGDPDFVAVAAGNVDNDPTLDCWSISNVARVATDGTRIPPGVPSHDQDDVEQ